MTSGEATSLRRRWERRAAAHARAETNVAMETTVTLQNEPRPYKRTHTNHIWLVRKSLAFPENDRRLVHLLIDIVPAALHR